MWEPQHIKALWASTACYKDGVTFYLFNLNNGVLNDQEIRLNELDECRRKRPFPN
jgi:hypothetical protein